MGSHQEHLEEGRRTRDRILRYLLGFTPQHWPPSVRMIGDAVGLASTSTVHHHLEILEREGLIERGDGPRQIRAVVR